MSHKSFTGESASAARPAMGPMLARKAAADSHHGELKKRVGNVGVQRLVSPKVQTKLTLSTPGDVHEEEAERTADAVMSMPANGATQPIERGHASVVATPNIHRQCAKCEEESKELPVQRAEATSETPQITPAVANNISALQGGGSPLPAPTRAFFEPRFGADLSQVRLHTDSRAADTAKSIDAKAFTVGQHIAFGANQYAPDSAHGQHLLAHELTHTIQQSAAPMAAKLNRKPDPPAKPATPLSPFGFPKSDTPQLLFSKGFHANPIDLSKPGALAGERIVSKGNIVEWAAQRIMSGITLRGGPREKDRLANHIRRGEVIDLHSLWWSKSHAALSLIAPSGFVDVPGAEKLPPGPSVTYIYGEGNPFTGSEDARRWWAKFLFANWSLVDARLDEMATDFYVEKIRAALHSKQIPLGASLVKKAARVVQIEDKPDRETVMLGRWGATAAVGFQWMGKRMKSISMLGIVFEVTGHEGIYFEMSKDAFRKTDPFLGKVVSDVARNTKGIVIVGQFIKGFLNALASPVVIVLDTAAKVLDMASMGISALGKAKGWYDIGYTCLSSTCRHYEECIKSKKASDCKDDVLQQAVEEATIIIPIVRQGAECADGDIEACGGIAALALGLVEGGVRKRMSKSGLAEAEAGAAKGGAMSAAELQEALIRDAIDRPRANDPKFGSVMHEPAPREKPSQARLEIKKPTEPVPKSAIELATEKTVDARAQQIGSEVKLGDGKHGVATAGEGKKAGFHLCSSHCSLVADKLEQIREVLPEKSDMRRDVDFLEKKVRGLDNEVKAGHLKQEWADNAARDIASNLRKSAGTPIIDTLLQMSVEELRANRASLKKQVGQAFELGQEVAKEFAEAGKKGVKTEPPDGTHATGTTTKPRTASLTDAEMLAAELSKDMGRPPGHEAHHIVPKGMKEGAEARQILEAAEIGINESANGIWLPRDSVVANVLAGDIHSRVHTARAIRIMTEQLREGAKSGPAGVRAALRRIQLTLSDLKFER